MVLYIHAFERDHFRQLLTIGDGDILDEIYALHKKKGSLKDPSKIRDNFNSLCSAIQKIKDPSNVSQEVDAPNFDHADAKTAWKAYWTAILQASDFNKKLEAFLQAAHLEPLQLLKEWHRKDSKSIPRPTAIKTLNTRKGELVAFILGEDVQTDLGSGKLVERLYGDCWDRRSKTFNRMREVLRNDSDEITKLWHGEFFHSL